MSRFKRYVQMDSLLDFKAWLWKRSAFTQSINISIDVKFLELLPNMCVNKNTDIYVFSKILLFAK